MSEDDTLYAYRLDTPAFSREYLDEEIPDFRAVIRDAISLQRDPEVGFQIGGYPVTNPGLFHGGIQASLSTGGRFVCHDAVGIHRAALEFVGDDPEFRNTVWSLTDHHALWDIGLFEQRLLWSVEGRAVPFPSLSELRERYQVDGMADILMAQFNRLVASLPILTNDVVGSVIFSDPPPVTLEIVPPERILARPFDFRERLHLFIHLVRGWRQYGPACIGLDVQGAIAASYLSDQGHIFTNNTARFRRDRDDLWRKIRWRADLGGCYPNDTPAFSDDGTPDYADQAPKKIRRLWNPSLRQQNRGSDGSRAVDHTAITVNQNRLYPLDSGGQASLNPNHWGESLPSTGPLRSWADYHALGKTVAAITRNEISYESQPYFKSDVLDFVYRRGRELLRPSQGKRFLQLHIRSLDVLCYLHTTRLLSRSVYSPYGYRDVSCALQKLVSRRRTIDLVVQRHNDSDEERAVPDVIIKDGRRISFISNSLSVPHEVEVWNKPSFFRTYGFFESDERYRNLFYAAAMGFLRPPRVPKDRGKAPRHRQDRQVRGLSQEQRFENYITSCERQLPDVFRENDLYLRISKNIILDYIRGHSMEDFYRELPEHFPTLNDGKRDVRDWIRFRLEIITLKSSYRWQFVNEILFVILPKCGIDPYIIDGFPEDPDYEPQLEEAPLFVDGKIESKISFITNTDPLLQREKGRAMIRNAIAGNWSGDENRSRHRRIWNDEILLFCREAIESRNIATDRGSSAAFDFFFKTNATSSTGKPSRPIYELEAPYLNWPELANDIREGVAYALIRQGKPLVAVADDVFVVEVDIDCEESEIQQIASLVQTETEEILNVDAAGYYGNFVESSLSDSWACDSNE